MTYNPWIHTLVGTFAEKNILDLRKRFLKCNENQVIFLLHFLLICSYSDAQWRLALCCRNISWKDVALKAAHISLRSQHTALCRWRPHTYASRPQRWRSYSTLTDAGFCTFCGSQSGWSFCFLAWKTPENKLSLSPSDLRSGPDNSTMFLHGTDIRSFPTLEVWGCRD